MHEAPNTDRLSQKDMELLFTRTNIGIIPKWDGGHLALTNTFFMKSVGS